MLTTSTRPPPRSPLRVLLVEDSAADARLLLDELRLGGFEPDGRRVSSEEQYLAALTEPPDVILADYTLPSFDAPSALELLRGRNLSVPFIVVTGTIGEDTAVSCMRAGATDYLLKDRLARLPDAVRRALVERGERDAKRRAEEALNERVRFEALFAALSTRLIHASARDLDAAIVEALQSVAESQGFHRTVVMLLDETREYFRPTYEWCMPGVESFSRATTGLPIADFGWPLNAIRDGQTVVLVRGKIPEDARMAQRVMERDGLELLATIPIKLEGTVIGCVGFHKKKDDRPLDESIVGRLNLVAEIVANSLARKRAEERRQAAFEELESLKRVAEQERDYLREEIASDAHFGDIIGKSPAIKGVLELVSAVASTKATVLVRGESGAGKELIARALHARSTRSSGPLVKVNCASIPKELFESEFFGHLKGAFTGAHRDRAGRFELADRGTIFLDEVGELTLEMQAKLLRILQESEFERVGDDRTRRVDVRVIAATNRDLDAAVVAGTFRQDLYYRLSVFPIEVPPLRARREDILPLAEHFLRKSSKELGRPLVPLTEEQRRMLLDYEWPGNIRELQHVIERAVILTRSAPLRLDVGIPSAAAKSPSSDRPILTDSELRNLETENIKAALDRAGWRVTGNGGAAELLGIRPSTLRDRMKSLGIQRAE